MSSNALECRTVATTTQYLGAVVETDPNCFYELMLNVFIALLVGNVIPLWISLKKINALSIWACFQNLQSVKTGPNVGDW